MLLHGGGKTRVMLLLSAGWLILFLGSVSAPTGSDYAVILGAGQGLLMVTIAALHGSASCGWRGFGLIVLSAALITFLLEACSIAYGFPFGKYTHHGAPGPAPLGVPISVMLGYVVLGWFAWCIAKLIVRSDPARAAGIEHFTTPLIGAFVLAGFDYPYDPIGSTVLGMWSFAHPGGQYGVPLSNYLGWIFTAWLMMQVFALIEARTMAGPRVPNRRYWAIPLLIWLGMLFQYPILYLQAEDRVIELARGRFVVSDIIEAAVAASLFSMLPFILLGLIRLCSLKPQPGEAT